jgi:hypothetical protein
MPLSGRRPTSEFRDRPHWTRNEDERGSHWNDAENEQHDTDDEHRLASYFLGHRINCHQFHFGRLTGVASAAAFLVDP